MEKYICLLVKYFIISEKLKETITLAFVTQSFESEVYTLNQLCMKLLTRDHFEH